MLQVIQVYKCSKCGSLDKHKFITKPTSTGSLELVKCKNCGHQKTISKTTVSNTYDTGKLMTIQIKPLPDEFSY